MIANSIHLVSLFSLPYPAGSFLGFVLHTLRLRDEEEKEEEEAKLMDGIDLIDKHTLLFDGNKHGWRARSKCGKTLVFT